MATYEEHVELVELQQSSAVAVVGSMGFTSPQIVTTGSAGLLLAAHREAPGSPWRTHVRVGSPEP